MLIATLFANYGPYHLARLRSLSKCCAERKWELVGIELSRAEMEYPWQTQVDSFVCPIVSLVEDIPLEQTRTSQLVRVLLQKLDQLRPDVLAIAGYARPTMLAALLWCRWNRKAAILLSDSKEDDAPRSWWVEALKRNIVQFYQAALVAGKPHKRYLTQLGMPSDAIFLKYDVVGNSDFHPIKIRDLPGRIHRPYFLCISRFVSKKNIPFLIQAYANYCDLMNGNAWDLAICGDGQLHPLIQQKITEAGLSAKVHLPGFLQLDELLPYFAHASCLIHASLQEQWGLVVNEAMAAGLPVLVSHHCGCFEDLVVEGVNGFGFDPDNAQELTNLMIKVSSGGVDLAAMGQAALTHIQQFSPDCFAQELLQAIDYAIASSDRL